MSAYEWTCSSCGHDNQVGSLACSTCACPSMATVKQIASFREQFERDGGAVLPIAGSIDDPDAEAALVIAGKAALTGLGWLAFLFGVSN